MLLLPLLLRLLGRLVLALMLVLVLLVLSLLVVVVRRVRGVELVEVKVTPGEKSVNGGDAAGLDCGGYRRGCARATAVAASL